MKFVPSESKHREDKQGYSKKIILDEKELNNPWSLVQHIKIKAWETTASHSHKIQTEIFYLLDDNWYRIVNGEEIHPKKWDVLVIEPNDKHTVIANKTADYIYLAFKIKYDPNDLYRD